MVFHIMATRNKPSAEQLWFGEGALSSELSVLQGTHLQSLPREMLSFTLFLQIVEH